LNGVQVVARSNRAAPTTMTMVDGVLLSAIRLSQSLAVP